MQYRLLRNNKESGPYTKAQLEEMGLKPYDLLWIEGRGGAWQYASEIEDLKSIAPVVEEQPYDRFYKGKEKQSATAAGSKQNNAFTSSNNNSNTATLKQPKPRFRISGDKVVMIDNAALQQPKPLEDALSSFSKRETSQQTVVAAPKPAAKQEIGVHIQSAGVDWEDMYSDWKGEAPTKEAEAKPQPDKAQTMEAVRQRYEEAKQKQLNEKQNKTTSTTRQNVMAAVAIAVLAIGGYAGYKINQGNNDNRTTQSAPAVEKAEVIQDEKNPQQNTNSASDDANTADVINANTTAASQQPVDNSGASNSSEIKNSLQDNSAKDAPVTPSESKSSTPDNKKEQPVAAAKNTPDNTTNEKSSQPVPTNNKPDVAAAKNTKEENTTPYDIKKVNTTAATSTPAATEPSVPKQPEAPAKKNISDYITVSKLGGNNNSGSVQNVLLSVKNVTDFPIDLAVIDIQYYGANGRYQKGETMYVKNIAAGNNINVRIPDGKTARSISYKVSLVSSEQKTLYLVGE